MILNGIPVFRYEIIFRNFKSFSLENITRAGKYSGFKIDTIIHNVYNKNIHIFYQIIKKKYLF